MARVALSAATWKNALVVRLSTIGSPATEPSRLSSRRTRAMRAPAPPAPAGGCGGVGGFGGWGLVSLLMLGASVDLQLAKLLGAETVARQHPLDAGALGSGF